MGRPAERRSDRPPAATIGLALAAALLAAAAVFPWMMPISAETLNNPAGAAPAGAAFPTLPPLATYRATVERPLFSPTRRAEPGRSADAAAGGPSYRLVGVTMMGGLRRALVAGPGAAGRTREIAPGDTLDGWAVTRIEPDRVVLSSISGEATLLLRAASKTKPSLP